MRYRRRSIKASWPYTVQCDECGRKLYRKAVVEHGQDYKLALVEAEEEAERLAMKPATCRDCEEAAPRALLLEMAAAPQTPFPEPAAYYGSPMMTLVERRFVSRDYPRCNCGAPCCSGYDRNSQFFITKKGLERAAKLEANGR